MVKRINAFRTTFNLLLSLVQLLIGTHYLMNIFGSDETANNLLDLAKSTLEQSSVFSSQILAIGAAGKPVAALVLVLGFMLLSFVLITIVPEAVERKEIELDLELADDD